MGLISKCRIHKCVYWGPAINTGLTTEFPMPVESDCRWDDEQKVARTLKNTEFVSDSTVMMGIPVVVGGFLWRGALVELIATYGTAIHTPLTIKGAKEIKGTETVTTIKNPDPTDMNKTALWAYL